MDARKVGLPVLAVLQALCAVPAHSQVHSEARFWYEIITQESIYKSEGPLVPRGYETGRALKDYEGLLPSGFLGALRGLGAADRWLDVGAGRGQAILDYFDPKFDPTPEAADSGPRAKARAVAISIEDRRTDQWRTRAATLNSGQIKYLSSKKLRDYSNEELGKFQIITDVFGGFTYTEDLSMFLEKILGVLTVNGSFYTLLQGVRLENGKEHPDAWLLTEIVDVSGNDTKMCSLLKRIACVQVTCESKSEWNSPTELFRIRKVCDQVSVPQVQRLRYEAGTPPTRLFQLLQ